MSTEQKYIVKEGAKVSRIITWLLYLSGTSEMYRNRFHAIVKAQNFSVFPMFPVGTSGRAQPKSLLGSVKK